MRLFRVSLIVAAIVLTPLQRAAAGGLEFVGAGSQAMGRGGAVTARADDPMVLSYNPAGLAELRGNQLLINANLTLFNACVDPIGYYGWGAYRGGSPSRFTDPATGATTTVNLGTANDPGANAYYNQPLDTVCGKQAVTPVPQIGFTSRVTERLGIGAGLIFPNILPQARWGGPTGLIESPQGLRPAATRYMQMNSGNLGLFPTIGFGFRVTDWLRIGAAFEWGIIAVDNTVMSALSSGTTPAGDIITHVRGTDWFVPAATGSIHIVPTDSIDIVGAFRYQGDLDASGHLETTTGIFDPTRQVITSNLQVLGVQQHMPWKLRGGIRYARRFAPRPTGTGQGEAAGVDGQRIHDALEDERWDVEVDVEYQMNGRHQDQFVRYVPGQVVWFLPTNGMLSPGRFPDATRDYTQIRKHWNDQISARVGGTYNLFPGLFGISAGAHYENRGVDPAYMQLDAWPLSRFGVHFGVVMRIAHSIDLVAAYSHIFQETLIVQAPDHAEGADISRDYAAAGNNEDVIHNIDKRTGVAPSRSEPAPILNETKPAGGNGTARLTSISTLTPSAQPPWIINAGTYRSQIDVVSVGMNVHF